MLVGYARVSTEEQDTQAQITALTAAGCEKLFQEKVSGGRWDRPELHRLLEQLRAGDVVVVWKLDRLSRSLKDLLHVLERIEATGARFQSLTESIDTSTPAGRMMMHMVGSFAEFERAMLRQRTSVGLTEARKAGRIGGRRPKLTTEQQREIIRLVESGEKSGADAARLFRVHPATVTRIMARHRTEKTSLPSPAAKKIQSKKRTSKKKATSAAKAKRKAAPKQKPAKGMPDDWTLDAVGLARPPEFRDFPGAVLVQRHEDSKTGNWKSRFEQKAMAVWEAEKELAQFQKQHAGQTITSRYPYPNKTILSFQVEYEGDVPNHRLMLSARNR